MLAKAVTVISVGCELGVCRRNLQGGSVEESGTNVFYAILIRE